MARLAPAAVSLESRFCAFAAERFPFALDLARETLRRVLRGKDVRGAEGLRALCAPLAEALRAAVEKADVRDLPETTPGTSALERLRQAAAALAEEAEGFLAREAVLASITPEEKRALLRGMVLTRAVDNRLKALFLGGEVRHGGASFQGKGFRSLGQEAIYGAALRLRHGPGGDVVGPIIRDLGVVLAMRPEPATVRMVLSAQMGKAGPPMDGRDLHVGDWEHGVLPASAPLAISAMTLAGAAMAFARDGSGRVAVTFIGEGGASLGEWHEAVNLCAARKLPAVFCLQNNQTALSTPVQEQAAVRTFADKAAGYGILGVTLDGTDPEAIAAAFAWGAERAREGKGPTLLELVAMRMCGHAHHDDMLYLGKEPPISWDYPAPVSPGYADAERYAFWAGRDPIPGYAAKLRAQGLLAEGELEEMKAEAEALVETEARAVIAAPWPDPATVGTGVIAGEAPRVHIEPMEGRDPARRPPIPPLPPLEAGPSFDPKGKTFLEAVMLGVGDALRADPCVFVYGEDVGGKYGNAFLLLRPLLQEFGDRILNSTLSEAGTLGVCVGAALCGQRPIGEIQFNDFVATGFNQLVNNAAKIRYRWGGSVPMVVRMPWGGLRRAGPYHSQNTEPWFYRTPGLKIVVPATPADARALMVAAVADPDPVLYYEHIALYRDPRIKQHLPDAAPTPLPLGKAALRRAGEDLALITYGAYVHVALRVAETMAKEDGVQCAVLDLRCLAPLDRETVIAVARRCGKVLICHEDSRTGGIGESLAAVIQEEAFEELDAPVRVVGALDTPVPYSPTLEDAFLPGEAGVLRAARLLARY